MWIGLADAATGAAIAYGSFSAPYANYGGGWYDVAVGSNTWVYARASGYNQASFYTNAYDSGRLYMTKPAPPPGGGGGKK